MDLSVGDKVRVYFYPPKTTQSFVEGIIDRNKVNTFQGLSFSLQTTREVILGHEITTPRNLPYIIAYVKDGDFDGRIEVLEAARSTVPEPIFEASLSGESDPAPEIQPDESAAELSQTFEVEVEEDSPSEPQKRGWRRLFNRAA